MISTHSSVATEIKIIKAAIAECLPGGSTYQYFASNPWEGSMRQQFADFTQTQSGSEPVALDAGVRLLRLLNARYSARYPVVALPVVYEAAITVLQEHGWREEQVPKLFQANVDEVQEIVTVFTEILIRVSQHPVPQPYSLLTKWLHFCLPDTFVIRDSQAVNSVQTCSDFLFKYLGPCSPTRRQFRASSIYQAGGSGYIGILNFYRLCADAVNEAGLMDDLFAASQSLEAMQHQMPDCLNTRISILDVLDKHLWQANGDAQKLGMV